MAKKHGIPLTLDTSGRSIKSHLWVSQNIWGDHVDPYGYLAQHGVSKSKLANDLRNRVGDTNTGNTEESSPENKAPKPDNDYQNKNGSHTF